MLETPQELDGLQALLDASMATAGPHLRDIISPERRLTAAQLSELRAAADNIQIVGARYPEAQDAMTNRDAPLPTA